MKLPHMPLWVYDIDTDRDCRKMSDATFGRYMRLLIRQWIEGSVPAKPPEAVRDAMLDPGSEGDVQSLLDRKFTQRDGDERRNVKCDEERRGAIEKCERNRSAGRKGGVAKASANAVANAKANGQTRASGSDSDSSGRGSAEGETIEAAISALADWARAERNVPPDSEPLTLSEEADLKRRLSAMPEEAAWVPQAVRDTRKNGTRFKGVAYAMKPVLNRVDELRAQGPPERQPPPAITPESLWERCRERFIFDGETAPKREVGHHPAGLLRGGEIWVPVNRLAEVTVDG